MNDEAELLPEMGSSRVEKGGCVSCEKMCCSYRSKNAL